MRYLLIFIFLIMIILSAVSVKKTGMRTAAVKIKAALLPALCLSLTIGTFLPDNLILNNMGDFLIGYDTIVIWSVVLSIVCFICLLVTVLIVPVGRMMHHLLWLITSASALLYLQTNWLNPKLPELDGRMVRWGDYIFRSVIDAVIWAIVLILPQILLCKGTGAAVDIDRNSRDTDERQGVQKSTHKADSDILYRLPRYISGMLLALQAVAFIITLLLPKDIRTPNVRLTEDGEFTLGRNGNVIIFVLDSLGAPNFEKALAEYPDINDMLDDFTYFSNEISGGSYTELGIPTLLTGVEFEPEGMSYYEYLADAWGTVDIYDRLKEQDYDIRLYTDNRYIANLPDGLVSNAVNADIRYAVTDRIDYTKQLYKLVGYYALPTSVKRFFWMNTTDITRFIKPDDIIYEKSDLDAIFFNDAEFYENYKQSGGLAPEYDKAYRVYHLVGAHPPYTLNAEAEEVAEGDTTETDQIAGCFKIVGDYIADLKGLGLYDESTIVITADHGPGGYEYGIQQNACLLIKRSGVSHPYEENKAPVHVRNLFSTIAAEAGLDPTEYGPGVWDIYDDSDVERLHTARRASIGQRFPEIPEDVHSVRFIIGKDGTDPDSIEILDGSAKNRFEYTMGDVIDLAAGSSYTDAITYRVYYDEHGANLSNELYLNPDIGDNPDKDIRLNFTYDHVYNDSQKARIYAEGVRIATLELTADDAGEIYTVIIPRECVRDGVIPLRFVFPGALTPHMIDEADNDHRVLSVRFDKIWLE